MIRNLILGASRCKNFKNLVATYINITMQMFLMNLLIASQFNYYHLVCMCYHHSVSNKVNRLSERCLRIVYSDNESSFENLLHKDRSVSRYVRNVQTLATECLMYQKILIFCLLFCVYAKIISTFQKFSMFI